MRATHSTTRDLALVPWRNVTRGEYAFTLPAGSGVTFMPDYSPSRPEGAYVVTSTRQLAELTGNAHDAAHRYVEVPADAVAPIDREA